MKGPSSYGQLQSLDGLGAENRFLVWSRALNDWITVSLGALRAEVGGGIQPFLANNEVILVNNETILANAETY